MPRRAAMSGSAGRAFTDGVKITQSTVKSATHAHLSLMLQHIKGVDEFHAFYEQCDKAGIPFSAYFHWSLKPKKATGS